MEKEVVFSHGGKREGAGRKRMALSEKKTTYSLVVSPEDKQKLVELKAKGVKLSNEFSAFVDSLYKKYC